MQIRLQKIIANAGLGSRRQAEEWIAKGKVRINGTVVIQLGTLADPDCDKIQISGRVIPKPTEKVYILFNKPGGCLTTTSDDRSRPTVMDHIKKVKERVFPVGRLDFHTHGLLLLTNDGELSKLLLDPKKKVTRTYQVKVRGTLEEKSLERLKKGIILDKRKCLPIRAKIIRTSGKNTFLTMKLVEGKNRHIKRVCEAIRHPVIKLKRTHFGFLSLYGVPQGKYRLLTPKEIKDLHALVS